MNSIRNKIVLSVFGISLFSSLAIGVLGVIAGTNDLRRQGRERLASIRIAKQSQVERSLEELHRRTAYHADSFTIVESMVKFVAAFDKLKEVRLSPESIAATKRWYESIFVTEYEEHGDTLPGVEPILPQTPVAGYLQYEFIVDNPHSLYQKRKLVECGDGSPYDAVHQEFHEKFDSFLKSFDYQDLLLFHPRTSELLYSTLKRVDLGTSMITGPFAGTKLAQAVREMQANPRKGETRMVDFEWYVPAYGHPVAFVLSPVFKNGQFTGIMALAIATANFDRMLFPEKNGQIPGLERTGDIFLFGQDGLMRSDSRFLLEDPEAYAQRIRTAGMSEDVVRKVLNFRSTILIVSTRPENTKMTFETQSGEGEFTNLYGRKILASYSVLNAKDLRWGIVAMIEKDEIFKGVNAFARNALFGGGAIVLLTTLMAMVAGQEIAGPIAKLNQAAKAFTSGFLSVRVHSDSNDEIAELARTFNTMAAEIECRTKKYEEKADEYRRLLENMMPSVVMSRFRQLPNMADQPFRTEATLAFAEIKGLDRLYEEIGTERTDELIGELHERFEALADRDRIEKLCTSGTSILFASGLTDPRFDHTARILEFAEDMVFDLTAFNAENLTRLYLSIGIHRGQIGSGNIGRQAFIHELWGRTIDLAREIFVVDGESAIRVSQEIVDRSSDETRFKFVCDEVGSELPTWTLLREPA